MGRRWRPCTFVSETGKRCDSRDFIEFDHVDPVARGGLATVDGMRLLCRAHNQFAAESTFGTAFMESTRHRTEKGCGNAKAPNSAKASAQDPELDVAPWLLRLGFRKDEVRRAVGYCETVTDASLEERVRSALSFLRPSRGRAANNPPRVTHVGAAP
jgi:hypothetical protein